MSVFMAPPYQNHATGLRPDIILRIPHVRYVFNSYAPNNETIGNFAREGRTDIKMSCSIKVSIVKDSPFD